MNIDLRLGDCLEVLKTIPDNSVDSVVTDPPYGLSFMGKKWDYDVPSVEVWTECLRVLKPGGHLLSFAGSRTYHRMAVRIEDAGFEIRDQIMWIYGQGFPKSHNISKQLDKRGGNNNLTKEVADALKEARVSRGISKTEADKLFCDGTTNYQWFEGRKDGVRLPDDETFQKICNEWNELDKYKTIINSANREVIGQYEGDAGGLGGERLGSKGGDITIPATNVAKDWEGWGTALKPAHEPIVMARKPLSEKSIAENVLKHGTGGINIDGSRIGLTSQKDLEDYRFNMDGNLRTTKDDGEKLGMYDGGWKVEKEQKELPEGRFPANIIFDEEAGQLLDEQSGIGKGGKNMPPFEAPIDNPIRMNSSKQINRKGYEDKGGASRFFYCPKAAKSDRNEGLDEFEKKGNKFMATKNGTGETSKGMERFTTEPKANHHPTVKPTDLMRYLINLVTPPNGTILDPFMGSGSTGKAAVRCGVNFIGIEKEQEYMDIASARIEHEQNKPIQTQLFDANKNTDNQSIPRFNITG